MNLIRFVAPALAICALALPGCQTRLKWTNTTTLEQGQTKSFEIDKPRYDQLVSVDFSSSDGAIDVFVCLEENKQAVEDAIAMGKTHSGVLGSQIKATSGTIEVSVPAQVKPIVFIAHAKKSTNVTLKIVGK